ncbi:MAG: DedA family protein [Ignavibacteriales bacterium]
MVEQIISFMQNVDPGYIYLILFFFAFIENLFPPSPSDVVVILGASFITSTSIGYLPVLIVTSLGSSIGFMVMFYIGKYFGDHVIKTGKLKFITQESLSKADIWFTKYGYKLIVVNRMLPGTRAVVSFFAGLYELDYLKTFILAFISSIVWNIAIIQLGIFLGNNIIAIEFYLSAYSKIVLSISLLIIAFFIGRYFYKKKKAH